MIFFLLKVAIYKAFTRFRKINENHSSETVCLKLELKCLIFSHQGNCTKITSALFKYISKIYSYVHVLSKKF